jgi:hypothetical protein
LPLAGQQLLARDVAALAHNAGFRDKALIIAVAVCSAESDRYTEAINTDNPDGSIDYGLWQINSKHFGQILAGHFVNEAACYDPAVCASIAHALQKDQGWGPWAAFTSGRYLDYIAGSLIGIKNYWLLRYDLPLSSGT